jgi:hypothetical protein
MFAETHIALGRATPVHKSPDVKNDAAAVVHGNPGPILASCAELDLCCPVVDERTLGAAKDENPTEAGIVHNRTITVRRDHRASILSGSRSLSTQLSQGPKASVEDPNADRSDFGDNNEVAASRYCDAPHNAQLSPVSLTEACFDNKSRLLSQTGQRSDGYRDQGNKQLHVHRSEVEIAFLLSTLNALR